MFLAKNPLLYPISVSECPRPGYGVLCISNGDLTLKIANVIVNHIKCKQTINGGLIIILK